MVSSKNYEYKNFCDKNFCAVSLFRLAIIPIGEYNDNQGVGGLFNGILYNY